MSQYDQEVAAWRRQVERVQLEQLQPWIPNGVTALQQAEMRERVKALGQGVYQHWRLRGAGQAGARQSSSTTIRISWAGWRSCGNCAPSSPAVRWGVVTAVRGIGGMGETELALTYAHAYAADYQAPDSPKLTRAAK